MSRSTVASKTIVPMAELATALAGVDIAGAQRAVVVVGGVAELSEHASAIRAAARGFASANNAKLCRIPQGANALGLSQHGVLPASRDTQAMLADARSAYVIYGIEPGLDFADQALALKALSGAQVVAFSHYACESTRARRRRDPADRRAAGNRRLADQPRRLRAALHRGRQGRRAKRVPGWRVLRALGADLGVAGFDFTEYRGHAQGPVAAQRRRREGRRAPRTHRRTARAWPSSPRRRSTAATPPCVARPRCRRIRSRSARASCCIRWMRARRACMPMAWRKSKNALGTATLPVAISDKVARGCAWVESGYGATAALLVGQRGGQPRMMYVDRLPRLARRLRRRSACCRGSC